MMQRQTNPTDQERSASVQFEGLAWSEAQVGARTLSSAGNPIQMLIDAVALLDCLVVLIAAIAASYMEPDHVTLRFDLYSTMFLAVILLFNVTRGMTVADRRLNLNARLQIGRVIKAWTIVFGILLLLAFLTKTSDTFSRSWSAAWYGTTLLGFALVRLAVGMVARRWRQRGRLARIVAILDLAGSGDALAQEIKSVRAVDIRLAGVFHIEASPNKQNGITDLIALSRLFRIDEIMVTVSDAQQRDLPSVLAALSVIPTSVRLCPDIPHLGLKSVKAEVFLDRIMLTVQDRPLAGLNGWLKRAEDLVLSLIVLVLTAPLMALIAMAVQVDSPGPILFCQRRLGFNNNVIVVYKFRTMFWNQPSDTVVPQAKRNDPRVTRVGKILRRTSLDELPQIFNVLRGDMSLVGPRPHALAHNDKYAALIDGYLGRHRVQPGITGWAQVSGYRGETDTLDKMVGRVQHDLAYIDNWSILLDLKIIVKTALWGAFDSKAY